MTTVNVVIEGVAPLLMHAPTGLKRGSETKRGSCIPEPEEEAKKALYINPDGSYYVPAAAILGCMREAGKSRLMPGRGKKSFKLAVMGGVLIQPDNVPLTTPGYEVDQRPVVIQRARIIRARPRFEKWSAAFTIENLDPGNLKEDALKGILEDGGKYNGLLDFRPQFGRFKVTKFEVQHDGKAK